MNIDDGSVSGEKTQVSLLILRRGALSKAAYFINNYTQCDFDNNLAFGKLFRYELSLLSPFELLLHLSYKRHFCC